MKLTDKCKDAFEDWFEWDENKSPIWLKEFGTENKHNLRCVDEYFSQLPDSMRYGVYVDFFDSVGIKLVDDYDINNSEFFVWYMLDGQKTRVLQGLEFDTQYYKTRHEARTKAIEKANELFNNK